MHLRRLPMRQILHQWHNFICAPNTALVEQTLVIGSQGGCEDAQVLGFLRLPETNGRQNKDEAANGSLVLLLKVPWERPA